MRDYTFILVYASVFVNIAVFNFVTGLIFPHVFLPRGLDFLAVTLMSFDFALSRIVGNLQGGLQLLILVLSRWH